MEKHATLTHSGGLGSSYGHIVAARRRSALCEFEARIFVNERDCPYSRATAISSPVLAASSQMSLFVSVWERRRVGYQKLLQPSEYDLQGGVPRLFLTRRSRSQEGHGSRERYVGLIPLFP